jgi:hypothetical protein
VPIWDLVNTSVISADEMDHLVIFVDYGQAFYLHPEHMAASIIDSRFVGGDLSDEHISSAESVILEIAYRCGISDTVCLDDLADFRGRRGFVYGAYTRPHIWKHASFVDLKPLTLVVIVVATQKTYWKNWERIVCVASNIRCSEANKQSAFTAKNQNIATGYRTIVALI